MSSVVVKGGASKSPTLSVCVVTYNHEAYLRDCLESIVQQAVNFDYEIIIVDQNPESFITDIMDKYRIILPIIQENVSFKGEKLRDLLG